MPPTASATPVFAVTNESVRLPTPTKHFSSFMKACAGVEKPSSGKDFPSRECRVVVSGVASVAIVIIDVSDEGREAAGPTRGREQRILLVLCLARDFGGCNDRTLTRYACRHTFGTSHSNHAPMLPHDTYLPLSHARQKQPNRCATAYCTGTGYVNVHASDHSTRRG